MQVLYIIWSHFSVTGAGAGCVWLLARRMLLSFISVGGSGVPKENRCSHRENLQTPPDRAPGIGIEPTTHCTALPLGPNHLMWNALDWGYAAYTHQRLGAVFGGRQKLSNIGRGLLLNGVSPLGGLTPLWLGCRGYGQEHGGRCLGRKKTKINLTCKC